MKRIESGQKPLRVDKTVIRSLKKKSYGAKPVIFAAVMIFLIIVSVILVTDAASAGKEKEQETDAAAETSADTENTEVSGSEATSNADAEKLRDDTTAEETSAETGVTVRNVDMSGEGFEDGNGNKIYPDIYECDFSADPDDMISGEPLVLVIHSHISEAYRETCGGVSEAFGRSDDKTLNIAAVGDEFTRTLVENGIGVIHCTQSFDRPYTLGAFERAGEEVARYLDDYPSVRFVIDIHRLSGLTQDGALERTDAYIDGIPAAQIGADCSYDAVARGSASAAEKFLSAVRKEYPSLCMPARVSNASYGHGSAFERGVIMLTLEIGNTGNTLTEARVSSRAAAEILAGIIKNQ